MRNSTKQIQKTQRLKQAASFRSSAETLRRQVAEKRNPGCSHQNLTARRAAMAASMAKDADGLEAILQVMENMAGDLEKNQLPKLLAGVTTRGMIETLLRSVQRRTGMYKSDVKTVINSHIYQSLEVEAAFKVVKRLMAIDKHDSWLELTSLKQIDAMLTVLRTTAGTFGITSDIQRLNTSKRFYLAGIKTPEQWTAAHETILVYVKGPSPEQERLKELKAMESSLIGLKIPGFFPTPKRIAAQLVEMAELAPGMTVLEPSAGKGDIAEVIASKHPDAQLTVIEAHHKLAQMLKFKGFNIFADWGEDFLATTDYYDRIIMNPPFEKGQDIDHVRHAYSRLRPGGKLVSIMCEGPFFRNDAKATSFRQWFENRRGRFVKMESGSFTGAEAFNQTGVATRVVIMHKNGVI